MRDFIKLVDEGGYIAPNEIWTLHQLVDDWINNEIIAPGQNDPSIGHRHSTIRSYQNHCEHIKAAFDNVPCDIIDYKKTDEARRRMEKPVEEGGRGLKAKHIEKKIRKTLTRIFDHGLRKKCGLTQNWARLLTKQKLYSGIKQDGHQRGSKEPEKNLRRVELREVLDPIEIKLLLAATIGVFFQTIFGIMVYAGLRISEALALRWRDIDVENAMIHVNATLSTEKIKDLPDQKPYYEFDPKTSAGFRSAPIIDRRLLESLKEMKAKATSDEWVFQDKDGGTFLHRVTVNYQMNRALGRAKIEKKISPHSLRHTFASLLIDMDRPITEVSKFLGHSSPIITLSIYTHFIERKNKDKPSLMDEFDKYRETHF